MLVDREETKEQMEISGKWYVHKRNNGTDSMKTKGTKFYVVKAIAVRV